MAGIIAYPELELGGQADQTIKGHKGAIKKFIKFRQSGLVNDSSMNTVRLICAKNLLSYSMGITLLKMPG